MKRRRNSPAKAPANRPRQRAKSDSAWVGAAAYARYALAAVLAAGIVLRILTFVFIGYFNNDNHLAVLEYMSRSWLPPHAAQMSQGYHPPLYYYVAAPFYLLGRLPAVQLLSLVLSIATLATIAAWLRRLDWIGEFAKPWCLALAAFHPQFIVFSLFVSNDTLAILLGALIYVQGWRLLKAPSSSNCVGLALLLGLGLLTKAVFLVFIPPLLVLVCYSGQSGALTGSQKIARLAGFSAIVVLIGSYKYAENFLLFGNPWISNLDFSSWPAEQKPTWIGLRSIFDLNLWKLVQNPIISQSTVHSYPLMIYGSFWYSLVPESTFRGNLVAPFNWLGSLIHLFALAPTMLMLVGAGQIAKAAAALGGGSHPEKTTARRDRTVYEAVGLFILLSNLLLIVAVGWRSDVWSVFQGRLLFPSYCAVLLALNAGMEWAAASRARICAAQALLSILLILFLIYFMSEYWLASRYPVDPLSMEHMPYKIDMNTR